MVRDTSRSEAQIVSYVVSGVGFPGAGVIFKDSGGVRGLNNRGDHLVLGGDRRDFRVGTAGARFDPGCRGAVDQCGSGGEQEITYAFELVCRPEDEAHMRALLLQAMSRSALTLTSLRSEDIEGTNKLKVTARIRGLGRQDEALEQLVVRLSLEAGVSSVSWAVHAETLE